MWAVKASIPLAILGGTKKMFFNRAQSFGHMYITSSQKFSSVSKPCDLWYTMSLTLFIFNKITGLFLNIYKWQTLVSKNIFWHTWETHSTNSCHIKYQECQKNVDTF